MEHGPSFKFVMLIATLAFTNVTQARVSAQRPSGPPVTPIELPEVAPVYEDGFPEIAYAYDFSRILSQSFQGTVRRLDAATNTVYVEGAETFFGLYAVHPRDRTLASRLHVGDRVSVEGRGLNRAGVIDDSLGVIGDCRERRFGLDEMRQLISTGQVRDQLAFLRAIPRDALTKFTFMHRSRSLQAAGASAQQPRVIRYSADGRTTIAYICDARQATYNEIEVMRFNDQTQSYEMARIDFKNPTGPRIEMNPTACVRCHGQNARPIWNGYDQWPGAMGSDDDQDVTSDERARGQTRSRFLEFRELQRDNPCYSTLPWPTGSPSSLYVRNYPYTPRDIQKPLNFNLRTNNYFLDVQFRLNARRIAARILSSTQAEHAKYLMLGLAMRCESTLQTLNARVAPSAVYGYDMTDGERSEDGFRSYTIPYEPLAIVAQRMGVANSEWDLDRRSNRDFRTGSFPMREFIAGALLDRMSAIDPSIAPYNRHFRYMQNLIGSTRLRCVDEIADPALMTAEQYTELCALLDRKQADVERRLGPYSPISIRQTPRAPAPTTMPEMSAVPRGQQLLTQNCASCHNAALNSPDLSDVSSLRSALAARPQAKDLIREAMASCRMPLSSSCLSAADQSAIMNYVDGL